MHPMRLAYSAFCFSCCFLIFGWPAHAEEWVVDYKNSSLTFEGVASGQPFKGEFKMYVAKVDFDLQKPESGKINAQIEMQSATTGDPQKDGMLPSPDWFDSKNIPFAEFLSTEIKKKSNQSFDMYGLFKLKMTTLPVTIPFTLERERDGVRARGQFTIDRQDYKIGIGEWLTDQIVAYPVTIKINLMAYKLK